MGGLRKNERFKYDERESAREPQYGSRPMPFIF
jgi:hypothetical protein